MKFDGKTIELDYVPSKKEPITFRYQLTHKPIKEIWINGEHWIERDGVWRKE